MVAVLSFDPGDAGYLRELSEYVAVPSVSRDASRETMRAAADWLAGQLAFAGPRLVQTGGHPVVRADWLGADGAPTILVYGHYDVQPTGDPAEWITPPFELTQDGDVVRGRGATDEKGEHVKDRPVTIQDYFATLLTALGVDPAKQYRTPGGRPIKLADKGKVVSELFS